VRRYSTSSVTLSILVLYLAMGLFGARNIYRWTTRLPVSPAAAALQAAAEKLWIKTARLGLEEPEAALETWFLVADGAHPLLYPKKYAAIQAKHKRKAHGDDAQTKAMAESPAPALSPPPVVAAAGKDADIKTASGPSVLVLGDSIMISVGPVIKRAIVGQLGGAATVNAKLSTGLARPDVYDWVQEAKRATAERRYDYVVMMLGTNDSQDFVEDGQILSYGTTPWVKAYNRRLANLMDVACASASHGVWIGLPPMRSAAFNRKAMRINNWARRQVERRSCMTFVSLDHVIGDDHGHYVSYRKIDDRLEKVRMVDGIHVTAQGGTLISASLLDLMHGGEAALSH
jgi:hypothetical protein